MKKIFFSICICVCILSSFSQNKKIDSLWRVYSDIRQSDSNRVKAIHKIAESYYKSKPDTAILLHEQELQLAKITKQKKHEGNALSSIGWLFSTKGNHSKTIEYYLKTLKIAEELHEKKMERLINWRLGSSYTKLADYPKAIEYYTKALKGYKEINDKNGMSYTYGGLAIVYLFQSDYQRALEYNLNSLKIQEEMGNKYLIASSLRNIGAIFFHQSDFSQALEYYTKSSTIFLEINEIRDLAWSYTNIGAVYEKQLNYSSALEYYLKSLKGLEELNEKERGLVYSNIGIVYENQLNFPKAIEYQLKGLNLKKEIKDQKGVAESYGNFSSLYIKISDNNLALQYCDSSLKLSNIIGYNEGVRRAYQNSAIAYSKIGKFKEAYENHLKFKTLTDSVFNSENSKQLGNLKTKFEVDKKEAELKVEQEKKELLYQADIRSKQLQFEFAGEQEKLKSKQQLDELTYNENLKRLKLNEDFNQKKVIAKAAQDKIDLENKSRSKQQRIIIFSVALGLLLVLTFSIFLYRRFKITQHQKTIIEEQKQVVVEQKHLVEEKHKEITDSINYAERIQRSFIATKEILDEGLSPALSNHMPPLASAVAQGEAAEQRYFVLFKPKDVVSGDFYWAYFAKASAANGQRDLFYLVTADSTGHGVPGAIMSLLNITSLEGAIKDGYTKPSEILNETRKTIIERLKKDGSELGGKDGMDASLTVYDFKNNKLIIAAANNPVWIVRGSEIIDIKPDKMPVGKHDKDSVSFTQQEIDLQTGDVVYTLTDGFPDQFGGEKGKKFMSKNLRELLSANAHLPMLEQKQLLEKTFSDWVGDLEQVDDVTLIGVRI